MEEILKQLNVNCNCHDTALDGYKYPRGIGCWNTPTPAWNSMDWKMPCIGTLKKEKFTQSTISMTRIILVVLIIALLIWFIYKNQKQSYTSV